MTNVQIQDLINEFRDREMSRIKLGNKLWIQLREQLSDEFWYKLSESLSNKLWNGEGIVVFNRWLYDDQ